MKNPLFIFSADHLALGICCCEVMRIELALKHVTTCSGSMLIKAMAIAHMCVALQSGICLLGVNACDE